MRTTISWPASGRPTGTAGGPRLRRSTMAARCWLASLLLVAVSCGPIATQQANAPSSSSSTSSSASSSPSTTSKSPITYTGAQTSGLVAGASASAGAKPSTGGSASVAPASASVGQQRDGASNLAPRPRDQSQFLAEGPVSPFADDSLWQYPVHLVREFGAADMLARQSSQLSANQVSSGAVAAATPNNNNNNQLYHDDPDDVSESTSADYHDDTSADAHLRRILDASGAPTVISASTNADLKTAAGYHHPTHGYHHHHHGYQPEPAHLGGHHYGPEPGYQHHPAASYSDAGHHHYGKYFQYASSPYPYAWDSGYRRGNPYHTIERYEHAKGPHYQAKVKWSDKYGGQGVHVWDYNHDDHSGHHYGSGGHHYDDNDHHHSPYAAGSHQHLGAPAGDHHYHQPTHRRRA